MNLILQNYRETHVNELYEEFINSYNWYPIPDEIKRKTEPVRLSDGKCSIIFIKDPYAKDNVVVGKNSSYYKLFKLLQDKGVDLKQSIWIDCIPYCPEVVVADTKQYRPPNTKERAIAQEYLFDLIDNMKPKLIVTFGNISLKMLKEDSKSIIDTHGQVFKIMDNVIYPMYSLNYVASLEKEHKQIAQTEMLKDIDNLIELMKKDYPDLLVK